MFQNLFIHEEYNTAIIENVLKRQKIVLKQIKREKKNLTVVQILMLKCFCHSWMTVFGITRGARDKMMRLLFMNGRHWKIMTTITMQYPSRSTTKSAEQILIILLFLREPYITNRRKVFMKIMQECFQHFESFCQVMDQCTENYECLVINNNARSNKLEDQIFWYKAEPHTDFKLGSKGILGSYHRDLVSDDEDEAI